MRALSPKRAGRWKKAGTGSMVLLVTLMVTTWCAQGQGSAPQPAGFSPPLGYHDGHSYATHHLLDQNGQVIEDTNYGVLNPDLEGATCFGVTWEKLYHAGQDLYLTDGGTEGAEITAVADGTVVYANPNLNYPGLVVIIEHDLPGQKIYSVYAHVDDNSLDVSAGQRVARGQRLGTVMFQAYHGRFPERHPGLDDSHLHFELRLFADGQNIYPDHPACNGLVAGRGYTYPSRPDDFPAPGADYLDPAKYLGK